MPHLTLDALTEDDLPALARYQNTTAEALAPMLAAARDRLHEGRYYEPFAVQTAQIRTDNIASIALHTKLGFTPGEKWINRRGHEVRTWRKEL